MEGFYLFCRKGEVLIHLREKFREKLTHPPLKKNCYFFKFCGKVWTFASAGHLAIKAPMPRNMHVTPNQIF